mmetsp:Transcript_11962/g.34524  ORF Transcript_11962/g.34524 Transcript_11962/m.34524 type:complete len:740 (-) Transcript_11962:301-2520(-)
MQPSSGGWSSGARSAQQQNMSQDPTSAARLEDLRPPSSLPPTSGPEPYYRFNGGVPPSGSVEGVRVSIGGYSTSGFAPTDGRALLTPQYEPYPHAPPGASGSSMPVHHHHHHHHPTAQHAPPSLPHGTAAALSMPQGLTTQAHSHHQSLSPMLMSWSAAYPPASLPPGPVPSLLSYTSAEGRPLDMQALSASLDRSKRRKLSADERLERSRERNRIHAKKTRLRKKQKMELLLHRKQELVEEQMRLKETIKDREAAPILLVMKNSPNGIFRGAATGSEAEYPEGAQLTATNEGQEGKPDVEGAESGGGGGGGDGGSDSDTEASDDSLPSHAGAPACSEASSVTSTQTKTSSESGATPNGGGADESSLYLELLKKDRSTLTAAESDLIRRERNRLHAKRTRDRKKLQQEETQKEIARLEKENSRLRNVICRLGMTTNYTVSKDTALLLPLEDTSRAIEERRKAEEASAKLHGSSRAPGAAAASSVLDAAPVPDAAAGGWAPPPGLRTLDMPVPSPLSSSPRPPPPSMGIAVASSGPGAAVAAQGDCPGGQRNPRQRSPQSDDSATDSNKTTEEERSGNGTSGNGSSSSSSSGSSSGSGAAASDLSTSGNGNGSSSGSGNGMSDLSSSGGSQQGYGSNGSGHGDGESNSDTGSNGDLSHGSRHGFGESNSDSGSSGGGQPPLLDYGSNGSGNGDGEESSGSNSPTIPQDGHGSPAISEEDEEHLSNHKAQGPRSAEEAASS